MGRRRPRRRRRPAASFADLPDDVACALVDDVLALFASRDQAPDATIVATDVDRARGAGTAHVEGPVAAVAAWLTRGHVDEFTGDPPPLPPWL